MGWDMGWDYGEQMHNGFVTVEDEKMSKSVGNFFTIRDVLKRYHPMALRWLLLGTHYRAPINYSRRGLEEASDRVYVLYQVSVHFPTLLQAALGSPDAELSAMNAQPREGRWRRMDMGTIRNQSWSGWQKNTRGID